MANFYDVQETVDYRDEEEGAFAEAVLSRVRLTVISSARNPHTELIQQCHDQQSGFSLEFEPEPQAETEPRSQTTRQGSSRLSACNARPRDEPIDETRMPQRRGKVSTVRRVYHLSLP